MKSISKQRSITESSKARRSSLQKQTQATTPQIVTETLGKSNNDISNVDFSDSWASNSIDRFQKDQASARKTFMEKKDVQGEIPLNQSLEISMINQLHEKSSLLFHNLQPTPQLEAKDLSKLFTETNNRFQYYNRVFTHFSVNDTIQLKNIQSILKQNSIDYKSPKLPKTRNSLKTLGISVEQSNAAMQETQEQTQNQNQVKDAKLSDYIPYQFSPLEIVSDNSEDFLDDFDLAQSILLDDDCPPDESEGQIISQIQDKIKEMKQNAVTIEFDEELTQSDLQNKVYNEIKNAGPFATILLPDKHIILPQIFLKHPMTIKGYSGTILEIVNGNFVCDFRQFIDTNFNGISPLQNKHFRVVLSEINLVFQFDPARIQTRLKESVFKETFAYSEICLQYFAINNKVMTLPLIVVQNCTSLDVNDCYFRSIQREKFSIQDNEQELEIQEIGFWVNGNFITDQHMEMEDMINMENNDADLRISSSIFYNFYDQVRVGLNSKILIEKCHFSESRNHSIFMVNPCSALVRLNTISRAGKSAICCQMLNKSHWVEKTRKVEISKNEIQMSGYDGIQIFSSQVSAHNLKVFVTDNVVKKCQNGLSIDDLVLNDLQICSNTFYKNEKQGISLKQVHQKSNKFKFLSLDNKISDTQNGCGLFVFDTGIKIHRCKIDRNNEQGIHLECQQCPKVLQSEVKEFLKRCPLRVEILDCEIQYNQKNGILVHDFWKGPISIDQVILTANLEYGLYCVSSNSSLKADDIQIMNLYDVKKTYKIKKSNQIKPEVPHQTELKIRPQDQIVLGQILLRNAYISEQILGAIYLNNVVAILDLETLLLQKNSETAIYLPEESMKNYIKLFLRSEVKGELPFLFQTEPTLKYLQKIPHEIDHVNKIQGKIGGPWGKFGPEKKKQGCCKKCFNF